MQQHKEKTFYSRKESERFPSVLNLLQAINTQTYTHLHPYTYMYKLYIYTYTCMNVCDCIKTLESKQIFKTYNTFFNMVLSLHGFSFYCKMKTNSVYEKYFSYWMQMFTNAKLFKELLQTPVLWVLKFLVLKKYSQKGNILRVPR